MVTLCSAPECDKPLPPATGSRPRLYCNSSCRRRAHEARKAAGPGAVATIPDPAKSDLAGAVRRELGEAGRLNTIAGQLAVVMALQIDSNATPASSKVSLSKELRALVSEATAGVKRPEDEDAVDRAKATRDRKLRAV